MAKVTKSFLLHTLDGVYDITLGEAAPEDRKNGIYSKSPPPKPDMDQYDDIREARERIDYQVRSWLS